VRVTIRIRADEAETEQLESHIKRRLGFALARISDELTSVLIRLDDLNGPRGGIDKRCHVLLRGPKIGEVVVEETDVSLGPAIDRALSLAGRSVVRALDRARRDRGSRLHVRSQRRTPDALPPM